jgi:catechol 2,3-dioxygenase
MRFHQSPIKYVTEVVLKVNDLQKMRNFYMNIIGFSILEASETRVMLTADGKTGLLVLEQLPVVSSPRSTAGLYHVAFLLPQRRDLANFTHHLVQHNIQFGAGDHLVSEALYLNDVEGNGIEIYADRDPDGWRWQDREVAMATYPVDFDDLLKEAVETFTHLPKATVIGHLHLQVNDLDANERFYHEGLGFDIVSRYGHQALFMSDGGYHHHVAMNTWQSGSLLTPTKDDHGIKSYSLNVDKKHHDQLKQRLQALGYVVHQSNGTMVVDDPTGIKVYLRDVA